VQLLWVLDAYAATPGKERGGRVDVLEHFVSSKINDLSVSPGKESQQKVLSPASAPCVNQF